MGDNKIRSTSDKIVGSPSDRKREVKSQESGENGSKSWIEKVRQYIGPASAGNLLGSGSEEDDPTVSKGDSEAANQQHPDQSNPPQVSHYHLLKTAFMGTLAFMGGAEARLEPSGSVPGLVGAALPPAPFAAYDQRVRFTSDYVPTPQNYKAFQQLEKR